MRARASVKPITAREAVIGLVAVVVAFVWYTYSQRARGRDAEKLAQNLVHIAALDSSLKVERGKFTVDTVRTFRRITNTVTTLDTLVRSDTLRLTDTVKVTVEVVREAVATLNACRQTVLDCGQLRAREQERGDSLNVRVRLMEKQRPSAFGNAVRSTLYLAAGFGLARLVP